MTDITMGKIEDIAMKAALLADDGDYGNGYTEFSSEDESGDSYSDSEDSDSSYASSSEDEKILMMIAKGQRQPSPFVPNPSFQKALPHDNNMHRSISLPAIVAEDMSTMQVTTLLNQVRLSDAGNLAMRRNSSSIVGLSNKYSKDDDAKEQESKTEVSHIQGDSMATGSNTNNQEIKDPTVVFNEILTSAGYGQTPRVFKHDEVQNFFQGITATRLSSYSKDIIGAVKTGDLNFLRMSHFELKRNMSCCNRFGESILHTACRHSQIDVVRFLVNEAKVDLRVCDDFGRTPCHDAAWQAEPNMELVELIVTEQPDLLLIADKRGFTPLQYVRKAQWPAWVQMLEKAHKHVLPKHLLTPPAE
jgi:hypothetical protein